jgi:hypothetical protein
VKAIIEAPLHNQRRMKVGQRQCADALYGKRDPVTWDEYEHGCRLSFLLLDNLQSE